MPPNITYKISEINVFNSSLDIDTLIGNVNDKYETILENPTYNDEAFAKEALIQEDDSDTNDSQIKKDSYHCSEIAAKALHYETNVNRDKLQHICSYYSISYRKIKKPQLALTLAAFELDPANADIVKKRETLWNYYDILKKDAFFSGYLTLQL